MATADEVTDHRLEKLLQLLPPIDGRCASEVEDLVLALSPDELDNQGRHFAFKHIARLLQGESLDDYSGASFTDSNPVNEQLSRGKSEQQNVFKTLPPVPAPSPSRLESDLGTVLSVASVCVQTDGLQLMTMSKTSEGYHTREALQQTHRGSRSFATPLERIRASEKDAHIALTHASSEDSATPAASSTPEIWICFSKLHKGTKRHDLKRNIESAGFYFDHESFRFHDDKHAFMKVAKGQVKLISTIRRRSHRYRRPMDVHVADPAACECEENMAFGNLALREAPWRTSLKSLQDAKISTLKPSSPKKAAQMTIQDQEIRALPAKETGSFGYDSMTAVVTPYEYATFDGSWKTTLWT